MLGGHRRVLARWILDNPRLAATERVQSVLLSERTLRQPKPLVENLHEGHVDVDRLLDEGLDGRLHAGVHSGWIVAMHLLRPRQGVVLGDVHELGGVEGASLIYGIGTRGLIPKLEGGQKTTNRSVFPDLTQRSSLRRLVRTSFFLHTGDA